MKKQLEIISVLLTLLVVVFQVQGAGTLTPSGSNDKPLDILSCDVEVTINNSYAKTTITQEFNNQNANSVDGLFSFPIPKSAALSTVEVMVGESVINGEVVAKEVADKIYDTEKSKGNKVAKAEKDGYQDFNFHLANIDSNEHVVVTFSYYQALAVDTGVVRYVLPLEEGNTKDQAILDFWQRNDKVATDVKIRVNIKSSFPLMDVRSPNAQPQNYKADLPNGSVEAEYSISSGYSNDFVLYYSLSDQLPGRLEVIPFRRSGDKEGTYMMVLTPGVDLKELNSGSDYTFLLDVSGSMSGRDIRVLAEGVVKTIGQLNANDRFRIITFASSAKDLTKGYQNATPENIEKWSKVANGMSAGGGTDLYSGMKKALKGLDADRVSSIILVTDGVTNIGNIDPSDFRELLKDKDIRLFGFLLGNQSNWPLMDVICQSSGGFYDTVSNSDDIIGKIMLAKSKVCHESIHNAKVSINGVKSFDKTGDELIKLYRGQQMIMFGKYSGEGNAEVVLDATISGQNHRYSCNVNFPAVDTDNPELERLWGLARIEMFESLSRMGVMEHNEIKTLVRDLGIECQLVTDETSMLVLSDEAFHYYGIEQNNKVRTQEELTAQSQRASVPAKSYWADAPSKSEDSSSNKPMFNQSAPHVSRGGGAMQPFMLIGLALVMAGGVCVHGIKK